VKAQIIKTELKGRFIIKWDRTVGPQIKISIYFGVEESLLLLGHIVIRFSVVIFSLSCIVPSEELSKRIELFLLTPRAFCFLMDIWEFFIVFLLHWNRISQDRFGPQRPPQDNREKLVYNSLNKSQLGKANATQNVFID